MSHMKLKGLTLAAAVAGAMALVGTAATPANSMSNEKCYGVAKAGENNCADNEKRHSCAGQATSDFDGSEWKAVPSGTCVGMGGSLLPFEGTNKDMLK